MKKLQNKVAIVTGSSKGIGAEIAKDLARAGAKVVVNYASSLEDAKRVVDEIKSAGGDAIAIQGDVSKKQDVKKLFDETIKNFKKLDILVNNAGIYKFLSLEDNTEDDFHRMFNLNVLGVLFTCQEAVKHMKDKGSIINIGSTASKVAPEQTSIYSATKGALDVITKVLAKELGSKNIRVNSINPGMVITEGVKTLGFEDGDFQKNYVKNSFLKRVGMPNDVAPIVTFLASDESSWITGELWGVSGGIQI